MTIQINKVEAQRGLAWVGQSWQLFKEQSGLWMQTMAFIVGIGIAAQILGQTTSLFVVIYAIVQPFLMAGYYDMVFKAKNGIKCQFGDVFIAFKDVRARRILLQIAMVSLLISLLASAMTAENLVALKEGQAIDAGSTLLYIIVSAVYLMFFFYAVPIAYFFHEQNMLTILKTSFQACWQNVWPLTLYGLIGFGLFVATVPTMLLGLLIVLPWLSIAFYLSFADLIGDNLPLDEDIDKGPNQNNGDDITFIV